MEGRRRRRWRWRRRRGWRRRRWRRRRWRRRWRRGRPAGDREVLVREIEEDVADGLDLDPSMGRLDERAASPSPCRRSAMLSASTSGYVWPPSSERLILTSEALTGGASVPPVAQVTVCCEPPSQVTAVSGEVTRNAGARRERRPSPARRSRLRRPSRAVSAEVKRGRLVGRVSAGTPRSSRSAPASASGGAAGRSPVVGVRVVREDLGEVREDAGRVGGRVRSRRASRTGSVSLVAHVGATPNWRNSGPLSLVLSTSAGSGCRCRASFCSQMYVSGSPSASVALPGQRERRPQRDRVAGRRGDGRDRVAGRGDGPVPPLSSGRPWRSRRRSRSAGSAVDELELVHVRVGQRAAEGDLEAVSLNGAPTAAGAGPAGQPAMAWIAAWIPAAV